VKNTAGRGRSEADGIHFSEKQGYFRGTGRTGMIKKAWTKKEWSFLRRAVRSGGRTPAVDILFNKRKEEWR